MGERDDDIKSAGRAEARARHEREDELVRGLADALEAKVRFDSLSERPDSSHNQDSPHGIAYDSVDLAVRTLREVLQLQTRAHRVLIGWLEGTSGATSTQRSAPHRVDRPLELRRASSDEAKGELLIENRLGQWLSARFPTTIQLGKQTWQTSFSPATIHLRPGETITVVVTLAFGDVTPKETLRGFAALEVGSDLAPIPVVLYGQEST
ncbi:MAG: hypothetical protein AAGA48_11440 [Myxococcota bacterium]